MNSSQLEQLERLAKAAAGTPYKAKGDWIYAQSVSHKRTFSRRPMAYTIDNRDGRYKPTETAAYIVAACNAVPELIAENRALQERVRELERQRWRIASYLETVQMCEECPAYKDCPSTGMLGAGECVAEIIKWGERVAKEGGE